MSARPIAELVPHGPPLLAVEEIVDWSPGRATVGMRVPSAPFARAGRVDAILLLEWMAQAVAACLGAEAVAEGGSVRAGMVVACRTMVVARPELAVGERLRLHVERVRGTDEASHFDTAAYDADERLVASATLTIVHAERAPA